MNKFLDFFFFFLICFFISLAISLALKLDEENIRLKPLVINCMKEYPARSLKDCIYLVKNTEDITKPQQPN